MAHQIPYDDPIWELTPTELNVAYLSLTLTKREIANRLAMGESTVGTHLTNIFDKLGLSGFQDDEKRSLLKANFGSTLERIVAEIQEDYQGTYRKLRREALETKAKSESQKQTVEAPASQPAMQEPPPSPRTASGNQTVTQRQGLPRIVWFIGAFFVLFVLCSFVGFNIVRGMLNLDPTEVPQGPSNTVSVPNSAEPSVGDTKTSTVTTQAPTQTAEPAVTATFTVVPPTETATTQPTAVPLPIREDFSQQYSDLWRVIGNPFITEHIQFGRQSFNGVLTTDEEDVATLWIGNTSWTDYLVSLRVHMPLRTNHLMIGVRVIDINNMIALDCDYNSICAWVVIYQGEADRLPTDTQLYMDVLTISAQGDTFTAVGNYPGFPSDTAKLILPPKYQGKFPGGGVLLQITSVLEIDFVQIDPFP